MSLVYLPAIFFGICTFRSYRKYGVNIQALMYGLFFLTGIASILVDSLDLYAYNCVKKDTGIIAPIMYCFLIWLCISPFDKISRCNITKITVRNTKILDYAVYFYFCIFLLISIVAFASIDQIITNANFAEVRSDAYKEHLSFYNHLSGIPRYICALSTFFLASSYIMIPVFFYNLSKNRKGVVFNIITLAGSCCQLLTSILQADRSQFLYWIILFAFSYIMFKPTLTKERLKRLRLYILPILTLVAIYFVAVSITRWGDSGLGTEGGTIKYAGQNYFNFCNFFNECWNTPFSLCEIMPFTYNLLGLPNYFDWCEVVGTQTHMFMAVFPTFVGIIASISTTPVAILYCFVYNFITVKFFSGIRYGQISFYTFILIWILAIVPLLGVFVSFYLSMGSSIALIVWWFLGKLTER